MLEAEKLIAEFSLEHPEKAAGFRPGYPEHHPDTTVSVTHLLTWFCDRELANPNRRKVSPFIGKDAISGAARLSLALKDVALADRLAAGDTRGAAEISASAVQILSGTSIGAALDAAFTAPLLVKAAAGAMREYVQDNYAKIRDMVGEAEPAPGVLDDHQVEEAVRGFLSEHPEHIPGFKIASEVMPGQIVGDPQATAAFLEWVVANGYARNLHMAKSMRQEIKTKYGV